MKKYFISFLLLLITPSMCLGASARYTQLVREKQRKMEQLEKCMGASKGLKIAGVSTIGLTAVGVAANIAEAKTIKTNEKVIEKKNKEIESAQAEIAKKEADAKILTECKRKLTDENANTDKITKVEQDKDGKCTILDCEDGYDVSDNGKSCIKKTVNPSDKKVVIIVMDEDAEAYKAYNFDGTCDINDDKEQNVSSCSGLSKGEWSATFTYGEVKGRGLCSITSGTEYETGAPKNTSGENCWCKVTGGVINTSSWVFNHDFGPTRSDDENCNTDCVSYCGFYIANYEELRRALFDYESE